MNCEFDVLRYIYYLPSADHAVISIVLSVLLVVNGQFEIQVCYFKVGIIASYFFFFFFNVTAITVTSFDLIIQSKEEHIQSVHDDKWPKYWLGTRMNLHCNKGTGLSLCPLGELC